MAAVPADPPPDTAMPLDDPDLREEQAALRRVATAVAEQRTPDEIFATLTREMAILFGATGASLVRFEPGAQGLVIADWSAPGTEGMPPGLRIDFELTARCSASTAPAPRPVSTPTRSSTPRAPPTTCSASARTPPWPRR